MGVRGGAIAANVRRLRNRKDVKARIGELSDFAGKLAGIDLSRDARATERMSAAHNDTVTAGTVTAGGTDELTG